MKRTKIMISCVFAAALLAGLLALSYFVFQVPLFDGSGWAVSDSGAAQYLDYYGNPCTGWVEADGHLYFFTGADCAMQTGWLETEDGSFYLQEDGAAAIGWLDMEDGRRYFLEDGRMHTGWLDTDAGRYYLASSGKMMTGFVKSGDHQYYLAEDGTMQTGWLDTEKGRFYLNEDGTMQISWLTLPEGRYFFNIDGTMRTGWLRSNQGTFFLTESGAAHTGWLTTEKGRYYMDETGKVTTGFAEIDGVEYYFLPTGEHVPLVNQTHPMPEGYETVLAQVEDFQVAASCKDALVQMMTACRDAGMDLYINSAYRDEVKQQEVWDEYMQIYLGEGSTQEEAQERTAKYVAVPGTSEHHTGLAIDFGGSDGIYAWLEEHCVEYGFILRYPGGEMDGHKITYEPWHFRYVGKEMAKAVTESGLMLEKYFESLK